MTSNSRFPSSSKNDLNNRCSEICTWFERRQSILLVLAAVSIVLLFILHLTIVTVQVVPGSIFQKSVIVTSTVLILMIGVSVCWKGMVPIAVCALGLTLLYAGILFPSYVMEMVGETYSKSSNGFTTEKSVLNAAHGYFFLGIGMVIFSMIIGYKPAILYTRNRPEPLDAIWKEYPIWYDNVNVVGGYNEPSVSLKSLMTTEEQYLLWRYEFVLTDIFGTPHLVKPDGRVPVSSTIFRDKENLSMMGKAKYPGYFV
jgi:hypothetical protein